MGYFFNFQHTDCINFSICYYLSWYRQPRLSGIKLDLCINLSVGYFSTYQVRIHKRIHYVRFYWHFWANLVIHIWSMLQVCIIAIWSQGLILNSGRSYANFHLWHQDTCLNLIQGVPLYILGVQNGKNDGFTKMSVEFWKSYIVCIM